ncbi:MAG: DUF3794 domain-containing protein [Eubacteriales bacterium]|nr:DUF3794 domain-containing protein [Eubacteriales bacterium]MDD4475908.1 DUF3794 domain-containing protein [Eubacteriales bacterium]
MTYEKYPFEFENIPDFALQPAKEADDEYNFKYTPRGAANRFDPEAYERILHESVRQAAEAENADSENISVEAISKETDQAAEEEILTADISDQVVEIVPEKLSEAEEEIIPLNLLEPEEEIAQTDLSDQAEEIVPEKLSEPEEENIPAAVPLPAKRSALQSAFVPKNTPPKIVPAIGNIVNSKLKLVDMKMKEPIRIYIEEDILVPDVKPDLARILSMDGKVKLAEREIHTGQSETDTVRISGDLILQTLYAPEHASNEDPIISIESKIPFKNETEMNSGPYSELAIAAHIESIDFSVVNERKFKAKATAVLEIKEYRKVDIEVFEGVRDEEIQILKEKINLTDVAMRKTDTIEVKENFLLKENMPEIMKILKYDINIVENHKQITKEKAVINASVYCNIMYLGAERNSDAVKTSDSEAAVEGKKAVPVFYQGKTEFTQFIRLDTDNDAKDTYSSAGKVSFNISSLNLNVKEDGNGNMNLFEVDMNVDTGLELYKTVEKEIVADIYHHIKDIQYDTDEIGVMTQSGSGAAELSAREIVNIPERYGDVDKVVYLSGNINQKRSFIDQAKNIVEGIIDVNLICTSADVNKTVFNVRQEIPFRSAMEIPGITPEMTAVNDIVLKELWFDKINNKQIEVNAGILVNSSVSSQKKYQLIKHISFLEGSQDFQQISGIILYISRTGDTIWKIAKKYRTTIDEVLHLNDLESGKEIKPGTKLLIVATHH